MTGLGEHHLRIQSREHELDGTPDPTTHGEAIRSWLTALAGAEHLALLIGSGLGIAVARTVNAASLSMDIVEFKPAEATAVNAHAASHAKAARRGDMNIEDQLRSALALLEGLEVLEPDSERTAAWRAELTGVLSGFAERALQTEQAIRTAVDRDEAPGPRAEQLLVGLLLAFASRPPSRERLNVFTTNYDRLIEFGCDLGGIRVVDRFVGAVEPVFRSSRLDVDLHYNPPGIRGEPRYLEGVLRLCKLHGSLDWRFDGSRLRRVPLAFGGRDPELKKEALERLMIYPNAAKDLETLQFPYAELFRDLSAALCRPNGVLVTYGYGFGDDHINRVIRDMLTLRSTHLMVISHSDPGGRIARFLDGVMPEQHSVLLGPHFGDLATLVDSYLPQAGPEQLLLRQAARRQAHASPPETSGDPGDADRRTPVGA
ncbi:MAG TPA: SIR2 family protein [Solirubrobacteraceae bacterium]|nr:SIR2 family protein [Solirubrobacteraceae bacterium]